MPLFSAGMALVKGSFAFLLFRAIHSDTLLEAPKSKNPKHSRDLLYASALWTLPWVLAFVFAPNEMSPAGRFPFFYEEENKGFDALQEFASSFEGVHLIASVGMVYNWVKNQTRVGRFAVVSPILYSWVFISALRDKTGYVDIQKHVAVLLLHLVYVVFYVQTVEEDSASPVPITTTSAPFRGQPPQTNKQEANHQSEEPLLAEEPVAPKKTN